MVPEQRHETPAETDRTTTAPDVAVRAVDDVTTTCAGYPTGTVPSLVTHCALLRAQVAALEAELDRRDRQLEEVQRRYEEVLAERAAGRDTGGLVASWLPVD